MKKLLLAIGTIAFVGIQAGEVSIPERGLQGGQNGQVSIPEKDLAKPYMMMELKGKVDKAKNDVRVAIAQLPTDTKLGPILVSIHNKLEGIFKDNSDKAGYNSQSSMREQLTAFNEIVNTLISNFNLELTKVYGKVQFAALNLKLANAINAYNQAKLQRNFNALTAANFVIEILAVINEELAAAKAQPQKEPFMIK